MQVEVECSRCDDTASVELEDYEDGSLEIECGSCGATLEVSYSVSIQIDSVDVSNAPGAEFDCPECANSMSIDDIEEENGSQEIECDCEALLEVTWSNWGEDIEVKVSEGSEDDDDDVEENGDVEVNGDEDDDE